MITKCYEYKSKICAQGVFRSARLKNFKNSIGKREYLWYYMCRI